MVGELGVGDYGNGTNRNVPVQVRNEIDTGYIKGVIKITSGTNSDHSIALMEDSKVKTWGFNSGGQLGNGNSGYGWDRPLPTQVLSYDGVNFLNGIVAMATGGGHTMALTNHGTVFAWGSNSYGELGKGDTGDSSSIPVFAGGFYIGFDN